MLPDESTGWIFVSSSDVVNSRQRSVSVQLILFLFEVECKSVTIVLGAPAYRLPTNILGALAYRFTKILVMVFPFIKLSAPAHKIWDIKKWG